jgi:DNA modification methylase
LGKVRHKNFVMGAGEVPLPEFAATLLHPALRCIAACTVPGALAFIFTDWRASPYLHGAAQGVFLEQKNLIVWAKTNAGMGTLYRSAHELIHLYKISAGKHINNFGLGEGGRHRSNVWTYEGANTFRKGRMEDLAAHSTVKPRKLVADAILDCSRRGGIVLDPFVGSGTTLAAAHVTGRRGYGISLDGKYVVCALGRRASFTGETPLLGGKIPFEEVAAMRQARAGDLA